MNKLNILFMASSKNVGLTFNLSRLAIALKKIGHNLIVVSEANEQEKGLFEELKSRGVNCYTVCGLDDLSMKAITAARIMGKIIDDNDVDVIHAQGMRHLLVAFFASKLFSRRKNIGIVVSLHTTFAGNSYENVVLLIQSFLLNVCADLALPVAKIVARKLAKFGLRKNKIQTVYNGIDLDLMDKIMHESDCVALLPSDFKSSSHIVIGYFARLVPLKGHKYLIEAISQLSKEFAIKLIIAGDGPLRDELKKQSRNLGIEESVLFLGWIDHTRIYQLLNIIKIYAFPSLAELFPFAILEAMAAGKPIIATDVGGVPEIVIDRVNGYFVPPKDPTSLAEAILKLIKNPYKATEMGAKGRRIVEQEFSIDIIARKLNDAYELALKRKISD